MNRSTIDLYEILSAVENNQEGGCDRLQFKFDKNGDNQKQTACRLSDRERIIPVSIDAVNYFNVWLYLFRYVLLKVFER